MNYSKEYLVKRSKKKYQWKKRGLTDYTDELYDEYYNSTNCMSCGVKFEGLGAKKKCLDHCHKTGKYRKICCHTCNKCVLSNEIYNTNKSGYRNIYYERFGNRWIYCKTYRGKEYRKASRYKYKIFVWKFAILILLNWKEKNNL